MTPHAQYLLDIIRPLIVHVSSAQVVESTDEMGVLLTLTVHGGDMGSIIGKEGNTAKCIRHLLRVAGLKQNARISLKINEPDGTPYKPRRFVSPEGEKTVEVVAEVAWVSDKDLLS